METNNWSWNAREQQLPKIAAILAKAMTAYFSKQKDSPYKPAVIWLIGNLGAGKTTFMQYLAKELGVTKEIVNSPTYNIVNEFDIGNISLYHCDFYRLNHEQEIAELDLFIPSTNKKLICIEWADKFNNYLAEPELVIDIKETSQHQRLINIHSANNCIDLEIDN